MVHIASSLNTPVIAIYDDNPQNFSEWKPLSDLQTVIFTRPPIAPHERVSIHELIMRKCGQQLKTYSLNMVPLEHPTKR